MQVRSIAAKVCSFLPSPGMAFTFALAGQAFIFLLDQKNEAKKIKAVKPRLQVDCKAFTARIAAASLLQSACWCPYCHSCTCFASASWRIPDSSRPILLRTEVSCEGKAILLRTSAPCAYWQEPSVFLIRSHGMLCGLHVEALPL